MATTRHHLSTRSDRNPTATQQDVAARRSRDRTFGQRCRRYRAEVTAARCSRKLSRRNGHPRVPG